MLRSALLLAALTAILLLGLYAVRGPERGVPSNGTPTSSHHAHFARVAELPRTIRASNYVDDDGNPPHTASLICAEILSFAAFSVLVLFETAFTPDKNLLLVTQRRRE